tara:strand:+ start:4460 stop:4951 length:492 start_codon:yes stop_codon:yes gene_type:complete
MPILSQGDMFFTPFEPKQSNRFFVSVIDGVPGYLVKGVSAISLSQTAVPLNHINIQRYVKGKTIWQPITFTLYESITPSGAQAVMEWVRLGHESVTGRDGYSDFYKKDITLNALGPVGDMVGEWQVKGAVITSVNFGDYNWDDDGTVVNITVEVQPDYCILNY